MVVVWGQALDERVGGFGMDELVELIHGHVYKDEAFVEESILDVLLGCPLVDAEGLEVITGNIDFVREVGKRGEGVVDGLGTTLGGADDEPVQR